MYESPINQILGELQTTYENNCIKAVQSYGFDVNKEELLKALQYDRNQYEKGYSDAIQEFVNMSWEYLGDKYLDWEIRNTIMKFAEQLKKENNVKTTN